jgi:uncharacterized membrane protein
MPTWALTLSYGLHLLATVALVGGLFTQAILVLPAASQDAASRAELAMARRISKRFQPIAWLSLAILAGTGMLQMTGNPSYQGFVAIENPWSAALLAKHAVFALMLAVFAYQTWVLWPTLERAALRQDEQHSVDGLTAQVRWQRRLIQLNFWLGVLILVLTSVAQTA